MNGDGGGGVAFVALLLFAAGPAAGWGTWWWIHNRYRNRDARYRPDRTVAHHVSGLTGEDHPKGSFRSKSGSTDGRNEQEPDRRARNAQFFHGELHSPPTPDEPGDDAPPAPAT